MILIETTLYIVLAVLIVVLLYLIYKRRQFREKFTSNPTSLSLYNANNSKQFDRKMELYKDALGDINDFLLVYGCGIKIGMVPTALEKLVKNATTKLYNVKFSVLSKDYKDVNSKIFKIIEDFYEKNKRNTIKGQIYVVVSQSPFYRDENNNPISLQYNADSYLYKSSYIMNNKNMLEDPIIQFNGYVIFTAYNESGNIINDVKRRQEAVINIKKNFRQKGKLCFVQCPNHKNLPCGCASQQTPYVSNCLESDRSGNMVPGQKYTYAMLYRVNPRFSNLISRKILDVDYNDYKWSPSLDSINKKIT